MEHLIDIKLKIEEIGVTDSFKIDKLINYANAIFSENKKYNLTGHKTIEEIFENLIIGSIEPISEIIVPRGTLFADLGTGAGIPGVPVAIKHETASGVLFDSNQKKIRFINKYCSELEIKNVEAVDIRVEEAGRENDYRNKFDLVITRAMSDIYTIAELGAPLLKTGGHIFLYVNEHQKYYNDTLLKHIEALGLDFVENNSANKTSGTGLLLLKNRETDEKYPRRMPVISRMAIK